MTQEVLAWDTLKFFPRPRPLGFEEIFPLALAAWLGVPTVMGADLLCVGCDRPFDWVPALAIGGVLRGRPGARAMGGTYVLLPVGSSHDEAKLWEALGDRDFSRLTTWRAFCSTTCLLRWAAAQT